jgi:hypothetical protein
VRERERYREIEKRERGRTAAPRRPTSPEFVPNGLPPLEWDEIAF